MAMANDDFDAQLKTYLRDLWPRILEEAAMEAKFESGLTESLLTALQYPATAPVATFLLATHLAINQPPSPPPFNVLWTANSPRGDAASPPIYCYSPTPRVL